MTILNIANSTNFADLTATYNLADGDNIFSCEISTKSVAIAVNAKSLKGVLNATITIYGSNTNIFADAVKIGATITLSATPYNSLIVKNVWNSRYLFAELTVNGCTGGTLLIPITLK